MASFVLQLEHQLWRTLAADPIFSALPIFKIFLQIVKKDLHAAFMPLSRSLSIGQKLRLTRDAKKMTLEELRDASGVDIGTISKIERGKTKSPGIQSATTLADALEVSPAFLITSEEDGEKDLEVALRLQALRIFLKTQQFSEDQQRSLQQLCLSESAPNTVRGWLALVQNASYMVEHGILG